MAMLGINFPPEHTGIAPYTGALARGLADTGISVRVHTAHPHYPQWSIQPGYARWLQRERSGNVAVDRRLHYVPAHPRGAKRLLSEITFGLRLLGARLGRPDVVIAVSPALFSTAIAIIRLRLLAPRTPVVVWVQDLYSLGISETGSGGGAVARIVARVESAVLRSADAVVVIHERFRAQVIDHLGVAPQRVEVVRNWTHLSVDHVADVESTRRQLGWRSDEIVVLHSGNMGLKQGLDNVIRAAELADERGERVRFVLAGDGSEKSSLVAAASGVARLEFVDPFDDDLFQAALASADVLLVNEKPGVSEMAVPSKLTSYFSSGRPVVAATDPSGITAAEVLAAEAGVVVESGRPELLLEAVLDLAADPERMRTLGQAGRKYRDEVLGEQAAMRRYAEILRSVLDRGRSGT